MADQNELLVGDLIGIASRAQKVVLEGAALPDYDPDWSWTARPGRFANETDLEVVNRRDVGIAVVFTRGLRDPAGARSWLRRQDDPAGRTEPPGPSRRRSSDHAQVLGGRLWSGVIVDVRGHPAIRVLQVALGLGWLDPNTGARALLAYVHRLRLWRSADADDNESYVVERLVSWARAGKHLSAIPVTRDYLRHVALGGHLGRGDAAAYDDADTLGLLTPQALRERTNRYGQIDPWARGEADALEPDPRSVRRLARQMRICAEVEPPTSAERKTYLGLAATELRKRAVASRQRQALKAVVSGSRGPRAVERFLARHADAPDLEHRIKRYIDQRSSNAPTAVLCTQSEWDHGTWPQGRS